MKIVLDNIIFSNDANGAGISNYWFELSKFLMKNPQDDVFFYEERDAELNFHRKQLDISVEKLIINPKSSKSSIIRKLSRVKPNLTDYFLFHSSYYRSLSNSEKHSQITTVHDFTHNFFATPLKRMVHNRSKYNSIKRADGIICISQSTYQDLLKFCPPKKNQRVAIIHNGVSTDYFQLDPNNKKETDFIDSIKMDRPFILYVGSRVNYKNFSFAVKLLKEMPDMGFVIVGSQLLMEEWKQFDTDLLNRTVNLSHVSNSDLNVLYNFAHAFIYPSSYEGFGIPIIEAMRAGCPVLALNNSSITEVAGDAGILFSDLDIPIFKKSILQLFDENYRSNLIGKGIEHSAKYSWEKCCSETHSFYGEIYQGG